MGSLGGGSDLILSYNKLLCTKRRKILYMLSTGSKRKLLLVIFVQSSIKSSLVVFPESIVV